MSQGIKHGLLVEFVRLGVDDNGTVYKVLDPVWPPFQVQSNVPVCPATHKIVQVLQNKMCRAFKLARPDHTKQTHRTRSYKTNVQAIQTHRIRLAEKAVSGNFIAK
jgi:hypothetical protein